MSLVLLLGAYSVELHLRATTRVMGAIVVERRKISMSPFHSLLEALPETEKSSVGVATSLASSIPNSCRRFTLLDLILIRQASIHRLVALGALLGLQVLPVKRLHLPNSICDSSFE